MRLAKWLAKVIGAYLVFLIAGMMVMDLLTDGASSFDKLGTITKVSLAYAWLATMWYVPVALAAYEGKAIAKRDNRLDQFEQRLEYAIQQMQSMQEEVGFLFDVAKLSQPDSYRAWKAGRDFLK